MTRNYMNKVPKHRVPKINVECIVCSGTKNRTLMSMSHADGYFRRHQCADCDTKFYSLAHYTENTYQVQATPFKDRKLSPFEQAQRDEWWAEAENVTLEVKSVFATEFIEAVDIATRRLHDGKTLSDSDKFIIDAMQEMEIAYHEKFG